MSGIPGTPLTNSFTIGTDLLSLRITDNDTGQTVVLDGKKDMWESNASDDVIKTTPIDGGGRPDHRVVANGWQGSINVDRANQNFGAYIAFLEQNYYNGGLQHYSTVTETVQRADGSGVDRFQYTNLVFHGYKPGSFQKMSKVQSDVSWQCQERLPL